MGQKHRLPQTHYDLLTNHYPWIVEAVQKDAQRFIPSATTILNIDGLNTRHGEALQESVQRELARIAKSRRMSPGEIEFEVESNPEAKRFVASVRANASVAYQVALNFEIGGKKVFYLSENLIDQLLETELSFPAELVQMPFPSCMFVLQGKSAISALLKIQPDIAKSLPKINPDTPISVYATLAPSQEFTGSRVLVLGAFLSDAASNTSFAFFKRDLLLKPGRTVEDALHTNWNQERRALGLNKIETGGVSMHAGTVSMGHSDERFYTDGLQFYRLVMNTILYLMSDGAQRREMRSTRDDLLDDAAKETKASRRRNKEGFAARFSPSPYILLGEGVGPIADRSGERSASAARIVVRGHFKNQAHGPGRSERKHIWVQPYYRGPEMSELVNKPYVVR